MARITWLALAAACFGRTEAIIKPTSPGGDNIAFRAGDNCTFSFERDPTGIWKEVNVDLFSGDNLHMVNVTRVASGLDGTAHNIRYIYECPDVDPPAPIYFYQFSTEYDTNRAWTSRFPIADRNGTITAPEHLAQPNGAGPAWGIGHLKNSTTPGTATSSAGPDWSSDKNASSTPAPTPLAKSGSATTGAWPWLNTASAQPASSSSSAAKTSSIPWQSEPAGQIPLAGTALSGFQYGVKCSSNAHCPADSPCCSELGFCGSGRNCLAGCNPLASFHPRACSPIPACRSQEYRFDAGANRMLTNSSLWNGDAEAFDWLVRYPGAKDLGPITVDRQVGTLALTLSLSEGRNGTFLTSTRSLLYGRVTAKMRPATAAGVLTSFSLMSGTEDEILYEFTTNASDLAHTAYFFRGDVDGLKSGKALNISDRSERYHDYTLDWSPERIIWLVDGVALRNISGEQTDTGKGLRFPRTPARIRFSIWGSNSTEQPEQVVNFLGGPIPWHDPQSTTNGIFASYISSVKVECSDFLNATSTSNATAPSDGTENWSKPNGTETTPAWLAWATSISHETNDAADEVANEASPLSSEWSDTLKDVKDSTEEYLRQHLPGRRTRRRRLALELPRMLRRAPANEVSSYSYEGELRLCLKIVRLELNVSGSAGIDDDGYVIVHGGSAHTTISSDSASGLDEPTTSKVASATSSSANPTESTSATSASGTQSATLSTSTSTTSAVSQDGAADQKDEEGLTVQQRWDKLGTAAHIGIYVGAAAFALFLVVVIGWIWRKASSRRHPQGTPAGYFPVGDVNNGGLNEGDVVPSGPMYTGAGPYDASSVPAPAMAGVSRSATSGSSRSSANKYSQAAGGYVPSSVLQQQYGVSYVPDK